MPGVNRPLVYRAGPAGVVVLVQERPEQPCRVRSGVEVAVGPHGAQLMLRGGMITIGPQLPGPGDPLFPE